MSNIYNREIYGYEKDHTRECVQADEEAPLDHGTVSVKKAATPSKMCEIATP